MNPARVLVLSTDPGAVEAVRGALAPLGAVVSRFTDPQAALAEAQDHGAALVVLDQDLPGLDTAWCLRRLAGPAAGDTPVLLLGGDEPGQAPPVDGPGLMRLAKPVDPEALRQRAGSLLRTRSLADLLEHRAEPDGLTGLHRRDYFEHRLEAAVASGLYHHEPIGLLLIDFDGLSEVNDAGGRAAGDQLLKRAAALLRAACRVDDTLCRFEGDTFGLILVEADDTAVRRCGRRLADLVASSGELSGIASRAVTVSIGGASSLPSQRRSTGELLAIARGALRRARAQGPGRVEVADPASFAA